MNRDPPKAEVHRFESFRVRHKNQGLKAGEPRSLRGPSRLDATAFRAARRDASGNQSARLWFFISRSDIFHLPRPRGRHPKSSEESPTEENFTMRRFLMIAAAGAIALVGLSANQCGSEQKPASPPAESSPPASPPPAESPPAETPPQQ